MPPLQQYKDPEDNMKVVLQVLDLLILRHQYSQVQVHGGLQKSDKKAFPKPTWKAHIGMNGWRK